MIENPIVGNIYRVIGNVWPFGNGYHDIGIGELVVCIDNDGTRMCSYRVVGTNPVQYIYNHDLEQVNMFTSTFYTAYEPILQWAADRNILKGSTRKNQMTKLVEEIGELAGGIARGNEDTIKDSIGDSLVVLTILAEQSGTSIAECLSLAWNRIKDRKGEMIDGIFVKEGG